MKNITNKNSNFSKIMAGILAGLMIFSALATVIIVLVH